MEQLITQVVIWLIQGIVLLIGISWLFAIIALFFGYILSIIDDIKH